MLTVERADFDNEGDFSNFNLASIKPAATWGGHWTKEIQAGMIKVHLIRYLHASNER